MLKLRSGAVAPLAVACGTALAQGAPNTPGVQVYGVLDASINWINNAGGSSRTMVDSGGSWADRIGFRGREDLGGGTAALFTIEQGFNITNGSLQQGGLAWGRQAFVGLSDTRYGTLTLGRQYDFAYAIPPAIVMVIGGMAGGVEAAGISSDLHMGGARYDNTAKWVGNFGSFRLGAMYGLGRSNGSDKMASAMLAYREGALNSGISYTRDNYSPVAPVIFGNEVVVATTHYDLTPSYKLIGMLGSSRAIQAADTHSRTRVAELGLLQKITSQVTLGYVVGASRIHDRRDALGSIKQVGLGATYDFSKRTQIYTMASTAKMSGSAGTGWLGLAGFTGTPAMRSTTDSQTVLKVGILHFF